VRKEYEGSLAKDERTLTLHDDEAEHLLAAAGARTGKTPGTYTFDAPLMSLTFARVIADGRRPGRLVLMAYERRPAPNPRKKN